MQRPYRGPAEVSRTVADPAVARPREPRFYVPPPMRPPAWIGWIYLAFALLVLLVMFGKP